MRNFAAATVLAVAAAVLGAVVFVVGVVGDVEALGLLSAQSSIEMTDMPATQTKAKQTATLKRLAHETGVALAVLVPDRDGRPDTWNAYSFNGTTSEPVFRGSVSTAPIGDGGELRLIAMYAVGGPAPAVREFLDRLERAGYRYTDVSPHALEALASALTQPEWSAAVSAVALGVLIALVAESRRRAARQQLRTTSGWSYRAVAAREALEIARLVGVFAVVFVGCIGATLAGQSASGAVLRFTVIEIIAVIVPTVALLVGVHAMLTVLTCRKLGPGAVVGWPMVVVAAAGIALVVVGTFDLDWTAQRRVMSESLERTLVREAAHGDDVVLGTTFTEYDEDVAFGRIALGPLLDGTASMARVSFVDHLTLVGEATAALDQYADQIAAGHGRPVLLVPSTLGSRIDALQAATEADLSESWEVEGMEPPEQLRVRAVVVPSTASIARSVLDWTSAVAPDVPTWPEVPVLVVSDPTDIAPNRLGTAVANGEVRFTDRAALERAVRRAGLDDVVLQYRRVGATVEGQLAVLRGERRIAEAALIATGIAVVFAGFTLTVDHRVRTRRAARLRFLAGRHPIVHHWRFVAVAALVVAGATAATRALSDPVGTPSLPAAAITAVVVALATGALLTVLLIATAREGRDQP
ncbi:hypothetical protein DEJ24_06040 [Curtobacterium sp. MCPF17_001]|uniref:hypothetical protein n=1 Tax=Curtobacterium sp. MCPF17_001 TaxID=2175651 RepID=UPI000DA8599D|nr:hypothetical protein [Curtobacterium sp. MCPF17_001]PZE61237.1 hypothetical protein DEJ24_06040 [Curtobacterium sp. MCPF17_001]